MRNLTGLDYSEMGKRIRQRRVELGMTQERLAELSGLSTSFIGHIERMEKAPSVDTMVRVCRSLDMSLDYAILRRKERHTEKDDSLYRDLWELLEAYS